MRKVFLILLFIYILWRDDFQKFIRALKNSDGDILTFLMKELQSKTPSDLTCKEKSSYDDDYDCKELGNEDDDEDETNCTLQTYTRKQVMELLHISESTLWRYQQKRILTAHQIGNNHVVFIKSEVDSLIRKNKKGGVAF